MATQFNKFSDRQNFKSELIIGSRLTGMYNMPVLQRVADVPESLVPFNKAKTDNNPTDKWVHFFIDDYQFERLWNFPNRYLKLLKRFKGVIAPDFSMTINMPKAQQIWNCYRNRALSYWLQHNGVKVIPTAEWAEYKDLSWCLDGLPLNSTIAISTYGCNSNSYKVYGLIKGIEKVCNNLAPSTLVMYGKEIKGINSLCKNVMWVENYCQRMKKVL